MIATMDKPKRGRGRPPKYPKAEDQDRSTHRFQVSLDPAVFAALEEFRKSQRYEADRSLVIEDALKKLLAEEGFYHPPKAE